jgi:hypothetical protein
MPNLNFWALFLKGCNRKLLALSSLVLIVTGSILTIFSALSETLQSNELKLVAFFPSFIVLPIFVALGLVLSYASAMEKKQKGIDWKKLGASLFKRLSTFSSLIVLFFIIGWIAFSLVFVLHFLNTLTWIGPFFKVFLCIIPFVLSLVTLCLILLSICFLFIAPEFFLKNDQLNLAKALSYGKNVLSNYGVIFKNLCIALLPLVGVLGLCLIAQYCVVDHQNVGIYFLQKLVLTLPTALLLSPFVNFFFFVGLESSKTPSKQAVKL